VQAPTPVASHAAEVAVQQPERRRCNDIAAQDRVGNFTDTRQPHHQWLPATHRTHDRNQRRQASSPLPSISRRMRSGPPGPTGESQQEHQDVEQPLGFARVILGGGPCQVRRSRPTAAAAPPQRRLARQASSTCRADQAKTSVGSHRNNTSPADKPCCSAPGQSPPGTRPDPNQPGRGPALLYNILSPMNQRHHPWCYSIIFGIIAGHFACQTTRLYSCNAPGSPRSTSIS
jgi:hypothetical protein